MPYEVARARVRYTGRDQWQKNFAEDPSMKDSSNAAADILIVRDGTKRS